MPVYEDARCLRPARARTTPDDKALRVNKLLAHIYDTVCSINNGHELSALHVMLHPFSSAGHDSKKYVVCLSWKVRHYYLCSA